MTRIRKTDLETMNFKGDLGSLYAAMLPVSRLEPGGEVIVIDESRLKEAFRLQFAELIRQNPDKVLGAAAPAPELNDDLARLQKEQREQIAREEAHAKAIEDAATTRLKQWVAAGLLDVPHNHNLMVEHVKRNGLEYTAYNVDIIVNHLKDQLHWAIWSKHASQNQVQVEPPQPEEVLGRVKGTGEKQLPLNSTEADLRKASTAQVQDWLERKREATGQKYTRSKHSHGTTFVEPTMN